MKYLLPIVAALALAATTVSTAAAGGSKGAPCVQYNKITHVTKCYPKGAVVKPVAHPTTPPGTTPAPPVTPVVPPVGTTPPPVIVPTPIGPPSVPTEFFCVQTKERGETAVQAYEGAFNAGGAWRELAVAGATLNIAGHVVTLMWENGAGVIVAPNVPGVGFTCDQPYVSTDGKVKDPSWLNGLAPILPIVATVQPA